MQHDNELSLLGRLARWLESQGAVVRSTSFSYEDGEAVISAVIDTKATAVCPRDGRKVLEQLVTRAETVRKLGSPSLPSTLEVLAANMAKSVMELKRLSRKRGEDYYFDLFSEIEKARKDE
jgi:uncharacterized membrane protein